MLRFLKSIPWNISLLVCGTSVGAGMLALPTVTANAGFFPSMFSNTLSWLVMLYTGIIFAEASLEGPHSTKDHDAAHFSSLSYYYLGSFGQMIGNSLFWFLYLCILIAYYAGATPYFSSLVNVALPFMNHSSFVGFLLLGIIMLICLWWGGKLMTRLNFILMIGLVGSFGVMIGVGMPTIEKTNIMRQDPDFIWSTFPILIGAYGYHNLIPTAAHLVAYDRKKLFTSIIVGTGFTFVIYSLWQLLVLGNLNLDNLLMLSNKGGVPIIESLKLHNGSEALRDFSMAFAFFALITSLLGVSFAMVDFIKDGFVPVSSETFRHLIACCLTVGLPLSIAWLYPNLFVKAFEIAGGYGETLLNGFFPIAMGVSLVYKKGGHWPRKKLYAYIFSAVILATVMAIESFHLFSH